MYEYIDEHISDKKEKVADAQLQEALSNFEQAKLQLSYTSIYAPQDGVITAKNAEAGSFVQAGTPLLSVVSDERWIVANFKENQVGKMHPGQKVDIKPGNCMPIESIPVGTMIHNIELNPGQGGKMVRAAGQEAQLMAKEGKYAHVRLPSGEMRLVRAKCRATIGTIGNTDHENIKLGKAGRKRHMGIRPTVRGSVMNPNDHPHGGGEGKAPVGHSGPLTPWGKPALGYKTRKKHNKTDKYIVKRRK